MLDLVLIDGRARGIIARNLVTGKLERFAAHAVVIATGGLWQCILFDDKCYRLEWLSDLAVLQTWSFLWKPLYGTDTPYLYPNVWRLSVEAYAYERVSS